MVFPNQILREQVDSMASLRMCLPKLNKFPILNRPAPFMEEIVVTKEGVTKLLKGVSPSKAIGPDEFHPRVLKELATE